MKIKTVFQMLSDFPDMNVFTFAGQCHDCKKALSIDIIRVHNYTDEYEDDFEVCEGAIYQTDTATFLKCPACYEKNQKLSNFSPCTVYDRVVGYLTPVKQWNKGKQAERRMRTSFVYPENFDGWKNELSSVSQ